MSITLPAAIKRTRQELAESEARTDALRVRLKALEEASAELNGDEPRRPREDGAEPRTDAILAVMRTQPTIAWTAATLKPEVGSRRGTVEESKDLAAALSYLRQQGKVHSPHRGEWMLSGFDPEYETLQVDPDDIPF